MYYIVRDNLWRDDLDDREVMVTIRCITYNHEKFIRDALEGFIKQKTNFRFEAIVHDDASTDGTTDILCEYAKKYPSIIKPIFETENQYSKHNGSLRNIVNSHLRGKYIALCEGDDYWTDPLKLQKQVDFLESHPDYSMCFHNAIYHLVDNSKPDRIFANLETREYSGNEIYDNWIVPTASILLRKEVYKNPNYIKAITSNRILSGDVLMCVAAAECGKLYCINEIMSLYRRATSGQGTVIKKDLKRFYNSLRCFPEFFGKKYLISTKKMVACGCMQQSMISLRARDYKRMGEYIRYSFSYTPYNTFKEVVNFLIRKISRTRK